MRFPPLTILIMILFFSYMIFVAWITHNERMACRELGRHIHTSDVWYQNNCGNLIP